MLCLSSHFLSCPNRDNLLQLGRFAILPPVQPIHVETSGLLLQASYRGAWGVKHQSNPPYSQRSTSSQWSTGNSVHVSVQYTHGKICNHITYFFDTNSYIVQEVTAPWTLTHLCFELKVNYTVNTANASSLLSLNMVTSDVIEGLNWLLDWFSLTNWFVPLQWIVHGGRFQNARLISPTLWGKLADETQLQYHCYNPKRGKGVLSAIGTNMYLFGSASIRYAFCSDSCSFRVTVTCCWPTTSLLLPW